MRFFEEIYLIYLLQSKFSFFPCFYCKDSFWVALPLATYCWCDDLFKYINVYAFLFDLISSLIHCSESGWSSRARKGSWIVLQDPKSGKRRWYDDLKWIPKTHLRRSVFAAFEELRRGGKESPGPDLRFWRQQRDAAMEEKKTNEQK